MPRRPNARTVNGVLLLDKPIGITSNAALQKARRLFNARKAGHTGTLDPMASGLLPLTFGEATKFSQLLLEADKEYEACVRLGAETDTGDAEGVIMSTAPVDLGSEQISDVLQAMRGEIEQIPPLYSALKRHGKPLYEYARAGIDVDVAPRTVHVHALECLSSNHDTLELRVRCSKGTYIRSLAIDIGRALGCGAHLSALRRTRIGPFTVADAVTLEPLAGEELAQRDARLAPLDMLAAHFPALRLSFEQRRTILHGQSLRLSDAAPGVYRLYGPEEDFLGLGTCGAEQGRLAPKRLIASGH